MSFWDRRFSVGSRMVTAGILITILIIELFGYGFVFQVPKKVEAAQTTIDATAEAAGTSHMMAGSQTVFVNDQTGYKFFRDANGSCVYRKTTDGGGTWSSTTTVDAQTDCIQIQVWYDRWTPGLASSSIHIATLDTGDADIWYNRLDPGSDTLLMGTTPVSMVSNSGQAGSIAAGENLISITRGTNGRIYAVSNDGSNPSRDSYIVGCTTNCNLTTGWTEVGTNPLDVASDYNILMPLASGNIMLINRDISADIIRFKTWNGTSWSASWTTIDAAAPENATYDVGMAVTTSSTTPGILYMAYIANNATPGTDDVIRATRYNGTSWSAATAVVPSTTRGLTNVAIGLDAASNDVYVAYSGQTTAPTANTANVYWRWSTSTMGVWSSEFGPVNTATDDIYGVDLNIASDQRLHVSWFENDVDDIFGDTILDTFPGIRASSTGSQVASITASTSNFYVGGAFVITNNYWNRAYDVTGITITESGTVDGANDIQNVKLMYESDTTAPYDCASVSYGGNELQFGATSTSGFSSANGTAAFSGTTVTVSTTTALCVYPVLTILDSAASNSTLEVSINNPSTDITITGVTSEQTSAAAIQGTTQILNDILEQSGYHWRNDNGSEATASSATNGVENTPYNSFPVNQTKRVRLAVSNEGSTSSPPTAYRLEFATKVTTCSAATGWTDVFAVGGAFDMSNTANLTNGNDTTVITAPYGDISNPNTTFLTPNGAVRDTSSETGNIILTTTQFVEIEYAIVASTTAVSGTTYCFRVTKSGTELNTYTNYPEATIEASLFVDTIGSQNSPILASTTANYVGGAFRFVETGTADPITAISITATGTTNATGTIRNIRLRYDLDTSAPYDCASESYANTDATFGGVVATLDNNREAAFTGSIDVTSTQTLCLYVEVDVTNSALNGDTLEIEIGNANSDVTAGSSTVSPNNAVQISDTTVIARSSVEQVNYHWRNNDGDEASATSHTNGSQNTNPTDLAKNSTYRLRLAVANTGLATSSLQSFRLEWAQRLSSCAAETSWTRIDTASDAWEMAPTGNLTDGGDTTNIAEAIGGVGDPEPTFITPNGGVKDTTDTTAPIELAPDEFVELEYAIRPTNIAVQGATYCFRVTNAGTATNAYVRYAEGTVKLDTDFKVQRGTATLTGTTLTLTAGTDYEAPASSTLAFIRITNTQISGAGPNTTGNRNANDITVYISNPNNIETSVTFTRTSAAVNTRVSWEIVEYIGALGGENEFRVRRQEALSYASGNTTVSSSAITGVTNWADVAVFITGQHNQDGGRNSYNLGLSTANYSSTTGQVTLTRGASGAISDVSYAAIEFTGSNWKVQRAEHTYTAASTTETESITSVNSLARTFIHAQKRLAGSNITHADYGHEVWLSSIGAVSFVIDNDVSTPSNNTSVAWIIENTQTTGATMKVWRSNGLLPTAATANEANNITIGTTLTDLTIASIFANNRSNETVRSWPDPILGARVLSSTQYELWRSDASADIRYRTEVVEWPTAARKLTQNYYRFYVHNSALKPTDPWPAGATDLGENTEVTGLDQPIAAGEVMRIRMSLVVSAASMPAGLDAFKLQYAERTTTCTAIPAQNWLNVGAAASTTALWTGSSTPLVDGTALSIDPPTVGDLLLSVSDTAGTVEEENNSVVNPFTATPGEDVEYDWIVKHNGANDKTTYCFRMVEADGTLLTGYNFYPTMRTAGYGAESQNWRWYGNPALETPTTTLAATNTAPIDVAFDEPIQLRITLREMNGAIGTNVKFKLQFSEDPTFATSTDVQEIGDCVGTSLWCYANGAGVDGALITTRRLGDSGPCTGGVGVGCGTHNESGTTTSTFDHQINAATEFAFTIKNAGARPNRVYYFRVYDVTNNEVVVLGSGYSYPSLASEGATLSFTMSGIAAGTSIAGVVTTVATEPARIAFGNLSGDTEAIAAYRATLDTNGTQGYRVLLGLSGDLQNYAGEYLQGVTGTNAAPLSWSVGCASEATSCLGYHSTDGTLEGGSARFAPPDTYARFSTTTVEEVGFSSQPAVREDTDIVVRLLVRGVQAAGLYEASLRFITVPRF